MHRYCGSPNSAVECLTLNGMLDTIDPATGQQIRVCLLSVRITSDAFHALNLEQVQPEHCLRSLKASVSRAPAELLPVKPLIELDMVDPRFVTTLDVMSGLDHRPNLMELSPTEFEGLITNLFAAMGLDTRQTRPSRDGGVDCVAFARAPFSAVRSSYRPSAIRTQSALVPSATYLALCRTRARPRVS